MLVLGWLVGRWGVTGSSCWVGGWGRGMWWGSSPVGTTATYSGKPATQDGALLLPGIEPEQAAPFQSYRVVGRPAQAASSATPQVNEGGES